MERLTRFAAELVALKPALIVVGSTTGGVSASKVTQTVPLIMIGGAEDPVALGLAKSFARPGGNITGFMLSADQGLVGKKLNQTSCHLAKSSCCCGATKVMDFTKAGDVARQTDWLWLRDGLGYAATARVSGAATFTASLPSISPQVGVAESLGVATRDGMRRGAR